MCFRSNFHIGPYNITHYFEYFWKNTHYLKLFLFYIFFYPYNITPYKPFYSIFVLFNLTILHITVKIFSKLFFNTTILHTTSDCFVLNLTPYKLFHLIFSFSTLQYYMLQTVCFILQDATLAFSFSSNLAKKD